MSSCQQYCRFQGQRKNKFREFNGSRSDGLSITLQTGKKAKSTEPCVAHPVFTEENSRSRLGIKRDSDGNLLPKDEQSSQERHEYEVEMRLVWNIGER